MDHFYNDKLKLLGFNQFLFDIFPRWEDVKDEILVPERKSGTGNGTIHVFLGAADNELQKEFSSYYQAVNNGQDPSIGAIEIKHYFLVSNVLSMIGHVCQYYYAKGQSSDEQVKAILSLLSTYPKGDGLLETSSIFKLSTGSSRLRPYFKQFDSNGVFTKLIRQLLLPNSGYKISLYRNSKGEYAAFWLIGFNYQTDFEADSNNNRFEKATPVINTAKCLQQIYYGAPGTGKSYEINRLTRGKEVIRTTFHPDSDYSTFVGTYKPTSIEVPVRDVTGKVIVENGQKVTENRIVYEFVEQAFLLAYIKSWKAYAENEAGATPQEQYLVIEEINRGNCAQIFGDLFQLLDRNAAGFSDYPIKADKDMKKQLAKAFKDLKIADAARINSCYDKDVVSEVLNGDILLIPDNLYIWATMNTSDQSLFPIDSAFKRRWDWKYVPIIEGVDEFGNKLNYAIKVKGKLYDWWDFVEKINNEIGDQTKSEDKKLGYFFCKAKDGVINAETFVSKVVFYLWNDVFKDQDVTNIFSDGDEELTFAKFYDTDNQGKAVVKEDKVEVLMKNLGMEPISEGDDQTGEDDEESDLEESDDSNSKIRLIIKFPDDQIVAGRTKFDSYSEALKKIGLERAELIAAEKKYQRHNCALIDKERREEIINDAVYSYVQIDNYYLVKGINGKTMRNMLNLLSERLNLNLVITYQ